MITVRQVKVLVEKKSNQEIKNKLAKKLNVLEQEIVDYTIQKESIDARIENEIYFVYEIDVELKNENKVNINNKDIIKGINRGYNLVEFGNKILDNRPIIVGSGPAGLFAALILAENNLHPLIIEQGSSIDKRVEEVEEFLKSGKLNEYSNIQFGEGGAGTFSDGKLNTLIKDTNNRGRKVFETFVECGANEEILFSYKPHIGTDKLRMVIKNFREKIISLGGEFRFNTKLTNIFVHDNQIQSIEINNNEIINTDILILAIGNASRDTYKMLHQNEILMKSKPFAVGLRIMHPQELIDESQFGLKYANILSPATYKLTYQTKSHRGVYTFCMCPGGYVINSSSKNKELVINGMSYNDRASNVANSAIVVTVNEFDYGKSLFDGLEFQKSLEERAYMACNGMIPVQTVQDFFNNKISENIHDLKIQGKYKEYNINEIIPEYISSAIKEALINFDTKIHGFIGADAILAAVETRTSSPIRILRNDDFTANIDGIYPIGEGAGYAGGITSSSIDGIKCAEAIIKNYKGVKL